MYWARLVYVICWVHLYDSVISRSAVWENPAVWGNPKKKTSYLATFYFWWCLCIWICIIIYMCIHKHHQKLKVNKYEVFLLGFSQTALLALWPYVAPLCGSIFAHYKIKKFSRSTYYFAVFIICKPFCTSWGFQISFAIELTHEISWDVIFQSEPFKKIKKIGKV